MRYPAYTSEHGIQAVCPVTGHAYVLQDVRVERCGVHTFVSGACVHCDAQMRTRGEASYDANEPQWHIHELETR